jgi:quinol monooxygenase YgiN
VQLAFKSPSFGSSAGVAAANVSAHVIKSGMVTIIAYYSTTPGKGDEVAAVLAKHVERTRTEPGCLQFLVNRSLDDPEQFVLYEQYVDEDAFQEHRQTPHFREYVEGAIVPLLAERTFHRYDLVEPAN